MSGINHGANLGDDITYSGTVAAALEGIMLGLPAIAVSQQADHGELDFRAGRGWQPEHFEPAAAFTARIVEELASVPMPDGHAAERERPLSATSAACARAGSASGSTTTAWS